MRLFFLNWWVLAVLSWLSLFQTQTVIGSSTDARAIETVHIASRYGLNLPLTVGELQKQRLTPVFFRLFSKVRDLSATNVKKYIKARPTEYFALVTYIDQLVADSHILDMTADQLKHASTLGLSARLTHSKSSLIEPDGSSADPVDAPTYAAALADRELITGDTPKISTPELDYALKVFKAVINGEDVEKFAGGGTSSATTAIVAIESENAFPQTNQNTKRDMTETDDSKRKSKPITVTSGNMVDERFGENSGDNLIENTDTIEQQHEERSAAGELVTRVEHSNSREDTHLVPVKVSRQAKEMRILRVGAGLDSMADQLIDQSQTGSGLRPFSDLRAQINRTFNSTPTVLSLISTRHILREQVVEAEAAQKLQVEANITGQETHSEVNVDGFSRTESISATKRIFDFGFSESEIDRVVSGVNQSLSGMQRSRSVALLELLEVMIDLRAAEQNLKLSELFWQTRLQFLELVMKQRDLGVSSDADVVRAEAKAYEAQALVPGALSDLAIAKAKYRERFGIEPPDSQPSFETPMVNPNEIRLDAALQSHPDLIALHHQYDSISNELLGLQASKYGVFSLQSSISQTENDVRSVDDWVVALNYRVPISDGGVRAARLRRLKSTGDQLEIELEIREAEIQRAIEVEKSSWAAETGSLSANVNVLKFNQRAYGAEKRAFALNRSDLTDIFRVQEDFLSAARDVVAGQSSTQIAFYRLLHESGLLLEQFELGV